MTTYAALLRGVNVGGHRRVPMGELRALLTSLGLADVQTYLQSGNAVFRSEQADADVLAAQIAEAIRDGLGVDTTVMVRSAAELVDVVDGNPWPERTTEPKLLHVLFLTAAPSSPPDVSRFAPEEALFRGRVGYLWYALGAGRSKLVLKLPGIEATARNWTTVVALRELAAE